MKILLATVHIKDDELAFPLAGAILKTAIMETPALQEAEVSIADFYLEDDARSIAENILFRKPDACGFTVYTWNARRVLDTAALLKEKAPGILIFAGGPQVSADPAGFWQSGSFSFLGLGEGENVLPAVLAGWAATGTITEAEGCFTGGQALRAPSADPGLMPSPYRHCLKKKNSRTGVLWEMSRGCPYNCSFCYESRGEKKVRRIPIERLESELDLFIKRGVREVWVLDPTFNQDPLRAAELLEMIIEKEPEIRFTFEIRIEKMTEELCGLFSRIDCALQLGIQSASASVLKNVNRGIKRSDVEEKCALMSGYGLHFGVDLIFGLPGDSLEIFLDSLDFAAGLGPNNIDIFPLSVLPGTELSEKAEGFGIKHSGFPDYRILSSPEFPEKDLRRASETAEAFDLIYNKARAFPWFGACSRMLGLKPSEIASRLAASGCDMAGLAGFLEELFRTEGKAFEYRLLESLINWSTAAFYAMGDPGSCYTAELLYPPEITDELMFMDYKAFTAKYGQGSPRDYSVWTEDGELFFE